MRRLRQFGVDDDDIGVGIVDHDLDRLHVDGGIDHRGESGIERIADDAAGPEHLCQFLGGVCAERREVQPGGIERVDQQAALAAGQRHGGEAVALRRIGMHETFGGLDQFIEAANADHALAGRDRIEGLNRAGERAGMRHRGRTAALGGAELERDHRLAGGARGLAGLAEHLGVPHAFEIDHDHADRRIGREIGHQVRRLEPGLVAGRDHVADADAAIFQRLADRHHDRAGLPGDRDGTGFHGDDAVVDIGEQVFARAQIAEAVRAGDGKAGFTHRLFQFDRQPLAFRVLQLAEARGDDGGGARAGGRGVADHLHRETRRHQHQHVVGLFRKAGEILVAGHAPDRFALGVNREQFALVLVLDQIVPDALGIVAGLVGRADQHDVARVQHRMDALDDVAGVGRGRPFFGRMRRVDYPSFHGACPYLVVSFGRWRSSAIVSRHAFSFFLLRLGEGGNTRWPDSALRAAHDIPAGGEFSRCPGIDRRMSSGNRPDQGGVQEIAIRPRRQRIERPAGRQHQLISVAQRIDARSIETHDRGRNPRDSGISCRRCA